MTWQRHAACAHTTAVRPEDFSPVNPGDRRNRVDLDRARHVAQLVCGGCPVRARCAAFAAEIDAQEVILGGVWFPARNAADRRPIDLLGAMPARIEAAA